MTNTKLGKIFWSTKVLGFIHSIQGNEVLEKYNDNLYMNLEFITFFNKQFYVKVHCSWALVFIIPT